MLRMTRRLYVCAAAAVWAWLAAVGVASPGGRGPGAELSGGAVLGARCAARCLGLHVKSAEGRGQVGRQNHGGPGGGTEMTRSDITAGPGVTCVLVNPEVG